MPNTRQNKPFRYNKHVETEVKIRDLYFALEQAWDKIINAEAEIDRINGIISATVTIARIVAILKSQYNMHFEVHPLLTDDGDNIVDADGAYVVIDNGI